MDALPVILLVACGIVAFMVVIRRVGGDWSHKGRRRRPGGSAQDGSALGAASGSATDPSISPQVGTRTTALIRTILDMPFMATPRATMVEVTLTRATVAVIVAARTPVVETVAEMAVAVATDACPTAWAMGTRSLLPREMQATTL